MKHYNNIETTGQLVVGAPQGTPPLSVDSSTVVPNLNADLLDGKHASEFASSSHTHSPANITQDSNNRFVTDSEKSTWNGKANASHTHDMSNVSTGSLATDRLSEVAYVTGSITRTARPLFDVLRADRTSFLPPSQIIIESSTDAGVTWKDAGVSDTNKARLFTGQRPSISIPLKAGVKSTDCMIRITVTGMRYNVPVNTPEVDKYQYWNSAYVQSTERYFTAEDCWVWLSSVADRIYMKVEKATGANPNSWSLDREAYQSGWSGGNYASLSGNTFGGGTTQTGNFWNWRFTFRTCTTSNNFNDAQLSSSYASSAQVINHIKVSGRNVWSYTNNYMYHDHLYNWDENQNAFFPATVRGTTLQSTIASGTAPLTVASNTLVTNLNADLLDGQHASAFALASHSHAISNVIGLQTALDGKSATSHNHDSAYEPKNSNIQSHISSTSNPHGVTKSQVGLGNVDNTSDLNKPISTATQTALNGKANTSHTHAITDVIGLQTALDGKSETSHTHTFASLTSKPTTLAGYGITDASASTHTHADLHTHSNKTILDAIEASLTTALKTNYDTAYTHSQSAHAPSDADKTETAISGATAKVTPVDADTMPLSDSAASNTIKKVTWSNIKATLKTYFDTLYNNYTHPTYTYTTPIDDTNTTLTSVDFVSTITQTNGHVTGGTKRNLVAGTNVSIVAEVDGDVVISSTDTNTVTRVQGTGGTLVSGDIVIQGTGLVSTSQSGNTITIATTANNYSHPTQSAITSDNANGVVLQDVSVNTLGHVTSVATVDLDGRYYTETETNTLLSGKQSTSEKGAANGYASLDAGGKVPTAQLPSYVDDVLEYANFASLPVTGETGKIYVTIDTNKTYRWSGTAYVYITSGAVDSVDGQTGVVNLSSVYEPKNSNIQTHISSMSNPHSTTAAQVGAEPAFTKNTAFNKNFGTTAGTVTQGNDARLSDTRTPKAHALIDTVNHTVSGLTTGHVIKALSATTYGFGTTDTAGITDNAVTLAKIQDIATATILGRATAGSGDPEALTASQVRTILNVADGANNYIHPASHAPSIITQDANNRFVTDTEKATWNAKSTLSLGTTSTTAFRGDYGNTAYAHSQIVTGNPHGTTKTDLGLGSVENKSSATIRSEITSSNVTTALGYTPVNPNQRGVANGYASLDASGLIPVSQIPSSFKEILIVANITARDAITDKFTGLRVHVLDASADVTVTSGWAEYLWTGSAWTKVSESESIDVVLQWANITGKPTSAVADIDSAVSQRHTHSNKATLDSIQEALTTALKSNYDTAYTHSQSAHAPSNAQKNSDITKAEIEAKLTGAITTHTHAYEPANANIQSHISSTSNPHSVTKSQVGLGSVENYGIATQAEAQAGTSNVKYMTPLRVKEAIGSLGTVKSVNSQSPDGNGNVVINATHVGATRKFTANFGNGSATQFDFTHNFGTSDVTVCVYENSTNMMVVADVLISSANVVRVVTGIVPTANQFRVVIVG